MHAPNPVVQLSKRLTVITSGVGGEEEARSAALGEDYQVLKALSAGSLMLVLCESSLVCLDSGFRFFSQHALDWLCDTAGRPSAFGPCGHTARCTRTTPAAPPACRQASSHTSPSLAWARVTPGCCEQLIGQTLHCSRRKQPSTDVEHTWY